MSEDADLGALLAAVMSRVARDEEPILRAHGLSMWEYAILVTVVENPGASQAELSRRSRRDPTRLIRHLDELGGRGLLRREVDPDDRRRHVIVPTDAGRDAVRACRRDIRAMERRMLAALAPSRRDELRDDLAALAGLPDDEDGHRQAPT